MTLFIEPLEPRELLSASPVHPKAGPAVIAADQAAIVAARAAIPLAIAEWNATLKADRAEVPAVRQADLAILRADRAKISQDRGNSILVQADQGQLLLDQAKFKEDAAAAQAKLKADQGAAKITVANDRKALNEAIVKLKIDRILK